MLLFFFKEGLVKWVDMAGFFKRISTLGQFNTIREDGVEVTHELKMQDKRFQMVC